MLASRLASRTILTSERDAGTQTSLSFETSSSIREEFLALFLEEQEEEERLRLEEEKDSGSIQNEGNPQADRERKFVGDMSLEELQRIHLSHLLDPNYDPVLLRNERQTISRFADVSNLSFNRNTASRSSSHARSPSSSRPGSTSFPLSFLPNISSSGGVRRRGGGDAFAPEEEEDQVSREKSVQDREEDAGSKEGEDVYTEWGFDEGEEDSVYAEVRAAVANTDDNSMPVNTLRVWILGSLGAILLSGVNQFFSYRYPTTSIDPLVCQLIAYPLGTFMSVALPRGHWFINPGPFSIKEHTVITIMSGVASGTAYAMNIITAQKYFYGQDFGLVYKFLLVLSTQLIGFSLGGLLRRFLVWPAAMIWPATLVNTALLNTLHSSFEANAEGGSRGRYFVRVTAWIFFWTWLPGYFFTALSHFDWVTWIVPNNAVVSQIFGYSHGLGLSLITLDYGMVSTIGNPLAMPWWATANMAFGFVSIICVIFPILYYHVGAFFSSHLPIAGSSAYDNTGQIYNISRILTANAGFNATAYREYSAIYMPISVSMSYAVSLACVVATLVHCALYYSPQLWAQARRGLQHENDIHAKLMRSYREVPQWWYFATLVINLGLALGTVAGYPTRMPVWSLFLAFFVSAVFALPVGIVQAISNQQVGLNVISELIIGFIAPHRPVAMMLFKTYSYISLGQGLDYVSNQKLAHYMKIPPKITFAAQLSATVLGAFVQIGVSEWMYSNIEGMCDPLVQKQFFCPSTITFGTSSVVWGLIGPRKLGHLYTPVLWGFFVGAVLPVPGYYLAKRYPTSWYKFINIPMLLNVTAFVPPYLPINISSFCYTNFFFEYVMRRYRFRWWSRYNYVTSAALSSGYAIAVIVIFFTLQFPKDGEIGRDSILSWWGNQVYTRTADAAGVPYKRLAPGETFGLHKPPAPK